MTIFFEETSLYSATTESSGPPGIQAPPPSPTPVEYFNDVYGDVPDAVGTSSIYDAVCASWRKLVSGDNDDVMTGILAAMEGTEEEPKQKQEEERAPVRAAGGSKSGRKKKRKARAEGVAKIPRNKRVFRNCRACGTRNHNRRLFCTGCYGGKHEMGYVEDGGRA